MEKGDSFFYKVGVTRMKMIWAIIRPEYSQKVIDSLENAGITAVTRVNVSGQGSESDSAESATASETEIPKEMIMLVLPDIDVARAVKIISSMGKTWQKENPEKGNVGDGKIFVTYVDDAYSIRTAEKYKGDSTSSRKTGV